MCRSKNVKFRNTISGCLFHPLSPQSVKLSQIVLTQGHFWKATTLKNLGSISEAFTAFLDGLKKSTIPKQEEKTDFIVEAVLLLSQLQGIVHRFRLAKFFSVKL